MAEWIKARGENILISVKVQPGASKDIITGSREGVPQKISLPEAEKAFF